MDLDCEIKTRKPPLTPFTELFSPSPISFLPNSFRPKLKIVIQQKTSLLSDFSDHSDYSVKLLSEILKMDPQNLLSDAKPDNEENLNPMLNTFSSFAEYKRILYPLMKIELLQVIKNEYKKLKPEFYSFNSNDYVGGFFQGTSFHFEVSNHTKFSQLSTGEIAIAKAKLFGKYYEYFVYIESIRMKDGELCIILQSSSASNQIHGCKNLKIKMITEIRIFLGAFDAVDNLNKSPYFMQLLNPKIIYKQNNLESINAEYVGYDKLNEEQKKTLLNIYGNLGQTKISLVEGPPGTGKSRLIANLALQVLYGKNIRLRKILICASSNMAVDNIACKLLDIRSESQYKQMKIVRFGVLEKVHPMVQDITLEMLVELYLRKSNSNGRIGDIHETLRDINDEDNLLENQREALNIDQLCLMLQGVDLNTKKKTDISNILIKSANIICSTLSSCVKLLNYTNHFDICIIDEATQCLEPWTLIPLQFGITSLVLVGDSKQLSGTVLSQKASKYGYGTPLYTRIENCNEGNISDNFYMLKTQYRMHPNICSWPSKYFYKNSLVSDESTSKHHIPIKPYSILSLDYYQNVSNNECKIFNSLEAEFVCTLIQNLYELMPPSDVTYGIITPYAEQRDILNKLLKSKEIENISAETVDSYQGQERDIIIISNTRTKGVGFLRNEERLNVALTRARKCLIICGNFCSLERVPLWKSLLEDAKDRSVFYDIKRTDVKCFRASLMSYLGA